MRFVLYAVAALTCLVATPSFAAPPVAGDQPIKLAQLDVRIGERDRDHDRDREHRYRERHEGCRDVTIRERRGDEVVVRHIRRCGRD